MPRNLQRDLKVLGNPSHRVQQKAAETDVILGNGENSQEREEERETISRSGSLSWIAREVE